MTTTEQRKDIHTARIGFNFKFVLAEQCVGIINARVYQQHRILMGEQEHFDPPVALGEWEEMRELIRSIEDPWQRKDFIMMIRYLFQQKRAERNMPARGRDYVRGVIACGNAHLVKPASRFYAEAQAALAMKQAA